MKQDLRLNNIPVDPPTGEQNFAYYKQKQAGRIFFITSLIPCIPSP